MRKECKNRTKEHREIGSFESRKSAYEHDEEDVSFAHSFSFKNFGKTEP